ncbi:MAG: hypothetical protein HYR84_12750, partial [Planctomycetes bacterium]|nr:hypothetical protein [Planctomycetota bacterium]
MSPQELVAGLRQSDPAARQELRKRFHADFLGMAEDCIRRFELDAEARVLASRLLKSIELWLTHPKKSLVRGMKWPALAAHVAKKAEELLTGPYVYNERLPGGLSATASRRAPRGLLTAGRYVIRWFSKALDTALGDVWDFEERPNGAMILLLGDVMGHGLLASLVAQVV